MKFVTGTMGVFLLLCLPTLATAESCWQNRAGIDMGSGTTKILVAEVNVCQGELGKILYEAQRPISFNDSLQRSSDNELDDKIQQEGLSALQKMLTEARRYHPQRITGVATAVFRSAGNGRAVIDRFNAMAGIGLKIISQQEEAELGFLSAKNALKARDLKENELAVWDIGGGSMQITAKRLTGGSLVNDVYQGKLASVTLKNYVINVLKDQPTALSPNPIGPLRSSVIRFVEFYARNDVPAQVRQDLKGRRVLGIGGVHGSSVYNQVKSVDQTYSLNAVEQAANEKIWKADNELQGDYRATDVSNLLLVEGYMKALGISEVTVVKASLIQGVLLEQ